MLPSGGMKYIAAIFVAGVVYLVLARQAPVAQAVHAITQAPSPGTDYFKQPLDRTHEVLDQARKRADDPAVK